ncbi:MAG TPA: HAD family hydrolase [Candidatus Eisenbacteria bacterium]|nr:HAD family hydrolase [Candidatus Eisenbacteria bacterium]
MKRWGVFLDRDGTIVPDVNYASTPQELVLYRRAGAALRELSRAGATLIVVSNQSAVARGYLDMKGLARMDDRLRAICKKAGVRLDAIYNCPHHPDFTGPCRCRKPEPGLIRKGLRDFHLSPSHCYLVGDHGTDLEAGRRVGLTTVHVLTGHGLRHRKDIARRKLADHVARDLGSAAEWILRARSDASGGASRRGT